VLAAPRVAASAEVSIALAARWRRLLAFLIDAVILTLVTGALWGRLLASFANQLGSGAAGRAFSHITGPYVLVLALTVILAFLYYWLLTGYWGTTIGKRSLGLWVVCADGRSPVSLRRSAVRALVFVLGGEVLLFFLVDNGWLLGDRQRRALHDKVARTLVVSRPLSAKSPVQ
jgi:uncharacterized RDD family membrane protein YckC